MDLDVVGLGNLCCGKTVVWRSGTEQYSAFIEMWVGKSRTYFAFGESDLSFSSLKGRRKRLVKGDGGKIG